MPTARLALLTLLALLAFAGNSLLCRAALAHTGIDPASFTTLRLASGALVLWALVALRGGDRAGRGSVGSALALFAYAAAFSFAYVRLGAGVGALLLFGAVQTTMIGHGLWAGERLRARQVAGLVLACAGLLGLLLPGASAPPPGAALLMLGAGVAWGVYSLRGKGAGDPLRVTSGNFARAVVPALLLSVVMGGRMQVDAAGALYAVTSGALASGVGYAIWYSALPWLRSTTAATVQLAVPVIASLGGVALLAEPLTPRLLAASVAVIGGIALVVLSRRPGDATFATGSASRSAR